jgi:hypothetical protein
MLKTAWVVLESSDGKIRKQKLEDRLESKCFSLNPFMQGSVSFFLINALDMDARNGLSNQYSRSQMNFTS